MVGSIDPRCETVRGTHWPKKGRVVDWSSRRGSHLGQRFKPPHQQAGHMDASDPIRPQKLLAARGPSTYVSRLKAGTTSVVLALADRRYRSYIGGAKLRCASGAIIPGALSILKGT